MPTGAEVLRARPLLSLDKLRWPWLFRPLRQGRDPYNVSQRRKKGQMSVFFPSSLSLWRAIKRCVSDENLQKYTSYRKDRFAQSGVFDILLWNLIATISISSCLYLSVARPRPHTHTQRLMGVVSLRWKDEKGRVTLAPLFLIRKNERLCGCQRAGSSTLSRTEP